MPGEHWQVIFSLLHILGLILFAGGQLWFAIITSAAEADEILDSPGPLAAALASSGASAGHGDMPGLVPRVIVGLLPRIANFNGLGILLLLVSGVGRLLVWRQPGLLLLPSLYGWLLFAKLLLYLTLVVNGIVIEHRHIATLVRVHDSSAPDDLALFRRHWLALRRRSRVNFVLTMVMVVLGETLALSPALDGNVPSR
ncbi:MAG: hypothetical protein HYY96_06270 [Candidatus Tectomicrobia bacterium]|nr:hypothetical protein [Candidatus Tectomicrobia bacterium]